jgi:hypothetical protein
MRVIDREDSTTGEEGNLITKYRNEHTTKMADDRKCSNGFVGDMFSKEVRKQAPTVIQENQGFLRIF